jgi:CBS domain-containing protein/gamma-glutamyl:cysteine ligase YbdK (ATP-grasp superfamily)
VGLSIKTTEFAPEEFERFAAKVRTDLKALTRLLNRPGFGEGASSIGAEVEFYIVNPALRVQPINTEIAARVQDPQLTVELNRFNLEYNLDPILFGKNCLSTLESQISGLLADVRKAADLCGAEVILTGILPTLKQADLSLENMTPSPRYAALNETMTRLKGGSYDFRIKGVDELVIEHDSVMVEACNTSFQIHFQVGPEEFARFYNVAQTVMAPVLAAATNAPLLFGRRLWHETRIALFEQSIDTRRATAHLRDQPPRVSFGQRWVDESVMEIYRDDISRFKVLFGLDYEIPNALEMVAGNEVPPLNALQLHNSTVYRWNRPCYGVSPEGIAHIRIEARFLPAGPTVIDEVANAAFWFGLLSGLIEKYDDVRKAITFDHVHSNFLAAARLGLNAQFRWMDGETVPAHDLILDRLLPLARSGLQVAGVAEDEITRYLDVIQKRVETEQTGSTWLLDSLANMGQMGSRAERMSSLTVASIARQKEGKPVHEWEPATLQEAGGFKDHYYQVGQFMTTDLFTVHKDSAIDLVAHVMDWQKIRHVPVEDDDHRLVGLVSARSLLRFLAQNPAPTEPVPVSKIMQTDVKTITADTRTLDAIELMSDVEISCLPVLDDGKLVGLVSEHLFLRMAKTLIEEKLKDS